MLKDIQQYIYQLCAEQPAVALLLAVLFSAGLLPFITMAALTPLVFILDFSDYVAENGKFYLNILQGYHKVLHHIYKSDNFQFIYSDDANIFFFFSNSKL